MCFGGVVVAIDKVLRSLKGKILLRINKSWVQNLSMSQKCNDQNTKVVRFYPWAVTIPYFSGANDRIEVDTFCCLVPCSKRVYKWKSWSLGAGSNSLSIVVSIINAQWQLFDSGYRNCKPVEKLSNHWRINQYLYTHASWLHWYSPMNFKLIYLIAISIRLRSIYVQICPVVILKQSHLK